MPEYCVFCQGMIVLNKMNLTQKLKDTSMAILPVDLIVLALHFTVAPLAPHLLISFLAGSIFVILGLGVFLAGADLGIVPAGSLLGASLTRTRNLPLILIALLISGFIITIAEPNLRVQGDLVESVTGSIGSWTLVFAVAGGIGIFLAIAMLRILLQIPFRVVIILLYGIALALATRVDPSLVAIAFDSSGSATGPLTVPFFIALGIGVTSVRGGKNAGDDSFGTTGIAAIGPIFAMVVVGLLVAGKGHSVDGPPDIRVEAAAINQGALELWVSSVPSIMKSVALSLSPLAALLVFFQITLLKLPPAQVRRLVIGLAYTWLGLVLFFVGATSGFIPAGAALGGALGALGSNYFLVPVGCALGSAIVCAEPAMWVLTSQVEEVTSGNIRKPAVLTAVALGVASGVALSMWRVLAGFSVWYLVGPLYILAISLTLVTPKLFASIAFDSGSVATGPVSSAFILPLTIGASAAAGGDPARDAFGLIAMIAITPPVSMQILGIIFHAKERRALKKAGLIKGEDAK